MLLLLFFCFVLFFVFFFFHLILRFFCGCEKVHYSVVKTLAEKKIIEIGELIVE